MSFAMQNTHRLFIFGCVLKPKAIKWAHQNRKSWHLFVLLNESSLGTSVWLSKYYAKSGRGKNLGQSIEKTLSLEFELFRLVYEKNPLFKVRMQ